MGKSLNILYDKPVPLKILHLHEAQSGLRAVIMANNIVLGPSIVGLRVSLQVTPDAAMKLAGTMTLKNALAGLSHGWGKEGFDAVSTRIRKKTKVILEEAIHKNVLPRIAAQAIARERDMGAMQYREH